MRRNRRPYEAKTKLPELLRKWRQASGLRLQSGEAIADPRPARALCERQICPVETFKAFIRENPCAACGRQRASREGRA